MLTVAVTLVVFLAGFLRGITGFGGPMLMAAPLSMMIGPIDAVVTALILDSSTGAHLASRAWPNSHKRLLIFLLAPTVVTAPIGGYLLTNLDPIIARKIIGSIVVGFSVALLLGLRYSGPPNPYVSIGVGGVAGLLVGSTSIAGPPVVLYLLSGTAHHASIRANVIVFVTVISAIGLTMLISIGAVTQEIVLYAAALCVPYFIATWIGNKLFARLADVQVRKLSLMLMIVTGVVALLL